MFQINWKTKSLLYKIFDFLKLEKFFYLVQKLITKRSKININSINKNWEVHGNNISKLQVNSLIEIGAGKSLEQNIFFSYIFENKIKQTVIDINKMIDFALFNEANFHISKILNKEKKDDVNGVEDIKKIYNIEYKAPFDLKRLVDEKELFDMCINTATLEHFSPRDLHSCLSNLKKIIKKNGYISSLIDYSDHYSHTDKNISALNFLKYSKDEWKKYNNNYLYQNRLRHYEYKKLFESFNFSINQTIKGNIGKPPNKISKEFDSKNNDTFILWGYYLVKNN